MKINFDIPILGYDGTVANDKDTAGQVLASSFLRTAGNSESNILKFYQWALALGSNQELDIDAADLKTIKEHIIADQSLPIITKAPLLKRIDLVEMENKKTDDKSSK